MAVTCSGVIRDPSNNPVPNLRITLRSIGTNATSLDGAEIVVTTSADGSYSFPLQEGRYGVFMDFGERTFVGEVVILDTTIDDTLNQYLINVDFASVIGPALAEFEALRNECLQAVTDAEAQVALATTQAQLAAAQVALATAQVNLATVQADRAETEADRASQISGLDTVEEAVDLAITNEYLTARTQGDVDAERALKRERFAGSGWEHFGKHFQDALSGGPINKGLYARTTRSNVLYMGRRSALQVGDSKTDSPVANIAGFSVNLDMQTDNGFDATTIKFSEAPDGRDTYNSTDGTQVRHADVATAFAAETATNQVVTRRVDMWGFEGFLEEVNTGNPFVYPNGLIQSQATTMNGITTVAGTRPVSYYAVFDGDTTSVGRGVNFFAATAAQQEAMLNDPKNNLYRLDDGRLVQFRVRQRTVAGAGNGDWGNIFSNAQSDTYLNFAPTNAIGQSARVGVQGVRDLIGAYDNDRPFITQTTPDVTPLTSQDSAGIFYAREAGNTGVAVNGECYFLVGGTVSRLNQGAYHPEHNSFGSMQFRNDANNDDVNWNGSGLTGITSQLLCFTRAASGTGVIGQASGRTNDNRLFDAIYADGLGGVVDYRWSANDRSDPKWGAQAKLEAEAGEYRGLEKLVRTTIANGTLTVTETELDVSVSGDFSNPVIVGTPASVLARFPTGFEGRLLATQPTGLISLFPDTIRKHKSQGNALRWSGAAWASFPPTFNIATNTWTLTNEPAANVVIFSTVNWANPTSRSANTALLNVQLGQYGVTATASSDFESGGLMFESMLGKVATSTATANGIIQTYPYMLLNLVPSTGMFDATAGRESQHAPLMLAAPTNNSRGIKYGTHQVNDNGQATLNFVFNELDHNGTDWGDDDRLRVLNGTYTNQNGVAGLLANVVTLALPYGLIRNEV